MCTSGRTAAPGTGCGLRSRRSGCQWLGWCWRSWLVFPESEEGANDACEVRFVGVVDLGNDHYVTEIIRDEVIRDHSMSSGTIQPCSRIMSAASLGSAMMPS